MKPAAQAWRELRDDFYYKANLDIEKGTIGFRGFGPNFGLEQFFKLAELKDDLAYLAKQVRNAWDPTLTQFRIFKAVLAVQDVYNKMRKERSLLQQEIELREAKTPHYSGYKSPKWVW